MMKVFKGWLGEKVATAGMWARLDYRIYRRVDNVIVNSSNGTTQIDHVLVSIYGIFIIETKNMKGWIYGDPKSAKWTQVIFRKKSQFQNPLRQNYRHTKCLAEYLNLDDEVFVPIVFFVGESKFKTDMPTNVLDRGLSDYIKKFNKRTFNPQQVEYLEARLRALKQDKSLTKRAHLDSLRARHKSTTVCPSCGGALTKRVAKKGKLAGRSFLGCSNYPKCKFTKDIPNTQSQRQTVIPINSRTDRKSKER